MDEIPWDPVEITCYYILKVYLQITIFCPKRNIDIDILNGQI